MSRKARWIQLISKAVGHLRSGRRPPGLRILLYHSVGGKVPSGAYDVCVEPQQFLDQMRWLRQASPFEIVGLEDGLARLRNGSAAPLVAVTFDDGYRDNLSVAAPILTALQIPFTVFVTAAFLEQGERGDTLYLTHSELRRLSNLSGVSIGAHGYSHRPLTRLARQGVWQELAGAKQHLETVLDQSVTAVSYPHGAVNRNVQEAASSAGYTIGTTSHIGLNSWVTQPLLLHRTEILGTDGLEGFCSKLHGDYDWYGLKQRLYWPVPSV